MGKRKTEIVNNKYKTVTVDDEATVNQEETNNEVEAVVPETVLKTEYDALYEKHLYKCAEFENYIKRTNAQLAKNKEFQDRHLLEILIPAFNTIYAAINMSDDEGLNLIFKSLKDALSNANIEIIIPKIGDTFDMDTMHAISSIPASDMTASNTIASVISPGYTLKDTFVTYPQVVVYQV